MYKIYLDGKLMYYTGAEEHVLKTTKLSVELNRFGSFHFTIGKENPFYGSIKKKKSIVIIYEENRRLYRGRVLDAKRGFHNDYAITCEGEMGFLKDSVIRPYEFKGDVSEYFSYLITEHNKQVDISRQFKVGRCTVIDPNNLIVRANINYPDTWKEIEEKLLKKLGGYLWTREEKDGIYIDYLKDFETINLQDIKFAENLLDFEEVIKGTDIATAIIPLGCKVKDTQGNDTEERLTIKSINSGVDYVEESAAVEKYGRIFKTVVWDDVTLPENLLRKAKKELQNHINLVQSMNLSAIDLHNLDADIRSFWIGNYTKVISEPHGLNELLLTRKIELDLLNPTSGKLSLGDERKTFIDKTVDISSELNGITIKDGKDGQDAVLLKIDSTMGSCFKADNIETTMNVTIFVGSERITDIVRLKQRFGGGARLEWQWLKLYEEDYGIILDTDPKISRGGFALTVHPNDVDAKVTFRCSLILE